MPIGLRDGIAHCAGKSGYRLAAHGPDGASTGLKSREAVRQTDYGDYGGWAFSGTLVRPLQSPSLF
jgi:hypothetical protein